jgi:TIR domain/FCD domain
MTQSFDVFLSHNTKDKPAVRELAQALRARGLNVWLDEWELVPGQPWQKPIEEIIKTTRSSAVLVGKDGFGPWQDAEMQACLSEFMKRKLPVIPVLLPGAPDIPPRLPIFLEEFAWVDLRKGLTKEGLDRVQWGVTGERPVALSRADPDESFTPLPSSPLSAVGPVEARRVARHYGMGQFPVEADGSQSRSQHEPFGWREVIVCLVDIAGLNPLLVSAYNTDLGQILLYLDKSLIDTLQAITSRIHANSDLQRAVAASAQSILIKPMGSQTMLVWEYPDDGKSQAEAELALLVVDFIGGLQDKFYANLDALCHKRVYNNSLKGLRIRIALSCGKAWKRNSSMFGGVLVDYTGLPVNEARQLLYQALPKGGLVASLHLEPYLFMERYCGQEEGRIDYTFLEGTNHVIPFWVLEERTAMRRRCIKRNLLSEFEEACRWLQHPYQSEGPIDELALSACDTTFVFELREKWEPQFAEDLALRVRQDQIFADQLRSLERTIIEMEAILQSGVTVVESPRWSELGLAFHSQIAELSDGNEGPKRKLFTENIYAFTRPVYKAATSDPSIVITEHRAIAAAIGEGDSARSYQLVKNHLRDHYERAKKALLEIVRDAHSTDTGTREDA